MSKQDFTTKHVPRFKFIGVKQVQIYSLPHVYWL